MDFKYLEAINKKKLSVLICGSEGQLATCLQKKTNKKFKLYAYNKKQLDITKKIISSGTCTYEDLMRDNINIIIPEN